MTNSSEYPSFFARFYDLIYDSIRTADDHAFYMRKILETGGRVLEIGVGTGRFFTAALEKGADIYGIDISPEMINILKKKIPQDQHHRVNVADICQSEIEGKYDLIIAPFRVFMHLTSVEDQLLALNKIFGLLKKEGQFIFDLFVPNLKMLVNGVHDELDFEGEYEPGKRVRRYTSMHADIVNQISFVTFRFEWEEDSVMRNEKWETKLRTFFRYEIEHLLRLSLFENYSVFGDFEENPLSSKSKEFIVVCKR